MDPESRFRASSESERGLNAGMSQPGTVWYLAVLPLARLVSPRADAREPRPADTGCMLRAVNWTARILGFAWITVLAFVVAPPHHALNVSVQIGAFCLAGLAMAAWTLMDLHPAAAPYRERAFAVTLGVMAVAAGIAATAGGGGTVLVVFAAVAAMAAGAEVSLTAALAVTGSSILAIEVSGLVFSNSYGGLLGLPAIVLGGLVVGRNRGAYRIAAEQAKALLIQRERLQAEQRRADLLEERARIAREIHDVLAHSLGRARDPDPGGPGRADRPRRRGQGGRDPGRGPEDGHRGPGRDAPGGPRAALRHAAAGRGTGPGQLRPTRSAITSRSATR